MQQDAAAEVKKGMAKEKVKPPEKVEQKDVKGYVPLGGSIWRDNFKEQWQGHYPPRRRIHA
eukprot:10857301-Prorocentrum_lima.AAC.1